SAPRGSRSHARRFAGLPSAAKTTEPSRRGGFLIWESVPQALVKEPSKTLFEGPRYVEAIGFSFRRIRLQYQTAQAAQLAALLVIEPIKAGAYGRVNLGLHSGQQLQSFGGDASHGFALIVVSPRPFDQATGLQSVHQASDIGSAVDHAPGDLATRVPSGMDPSQDAQHVVLRARNTVHFAKFIHQVIQRMGCH